MSKKGFTLVELLIVISIMGVLSAATMASYKTWQSRNILINTKQTVVQVMREAQALASTGSNDSKWGVKLEGGKLVLFSGNTFEERDVHKDQFFEISRYVEIAGPDQVIFSKNSGLPQSNSTTTISYEGKNIYIKLNSQGVFSY